MGDLYVKYFYPPTWHDDVAPWFDGPAAWYVWHLGAPISEPFAERSHAHAHMMALQESARAVHAAALRARLGIRAEG